LVSGRAAVCRCPIRSWWAFAHSCWAIKGTYNTPRNSVRTPRVLCRSGVCC
jgi:hypothetical protein